MQKLSARILLNQHIRRSCVLYRHLSTRQSASQTVEPYWYKPEGQETGIRVYNCIRKRQVPLVFPNANYVSWYTCGPTVYDSTHLGHASCYVKLDIIQRILRQHFKLNVVSVMNITDIDDKIIDRSKESDKDWRELARGYEAEFWTDMRNLNVAKPNLKLRVTEQIPRIIEFIQRILDKGNAYVGSDKSVYFDMRKYPMYGKLQNLKLDELKNLDGKGESKNFAGDFALWKAKKRTNEPAWPAPWGPGRPGWHIECSALASMIFGGQIDIHAGGMDLRFPHHENEEAQCCVYHGTDQWVNYWLHTGYLNIRGQSEKMSKSLKNTISISDMLKDYTADEFRMACALSNYRNTVEYGSELMETARNTLNKFISFRLDCHAYLTGKKTGDTSRPLDANFILENLSYSNSHIDACFKDDFDTAHAITVLLDQISSISRYINGKGENRPQLQTANCLDTIAAVDNFVVRILDTMGFEFVNQKGSSALSPEQEEFDLNGLLEDLLHSRKIIRERAVLGKSQELFRICDELRNCLQQNGIEVKDHNKGSTWRFAGGYGKK